jgi:hypothetical protein
MGEGDVLLGDNSASKANMLWDKSTGELLLRAGQTAKVKIDTSGRLVTNDNVYLGGDYGLQFKGSTGNIRHIGWQYFDDPTYRWVGEVYGDYGGSGDAVMWLRSLKATGDPWSESMVVLLADNGVASTLSRIDLTSDGNIYVYADLLETNTALGHAGDIKAAGDIYTAPWADYSGTSTIIGWATLENSQKIMYKRVGNTVDIMVDLDGTSNATTVSFTLPFAKTSDANLEVGLRTYNNGAGYDANYGTAQVLSGTNTCTVIRQAGAWTAANRKIVRVQFSYETA